MLKLGQVVKENPREEEEKGNTKGAKENQPISRRS